MDKIYKIGLIGCGRISNNHFDVIKNNPRLELVAVCDEIGERSKEKSDLYKVKSYTDVDKFFSHKMDIVSICTPSGLHPLHGIKAAKNMIHVVSEKPMAVEMAGARELITACKTSKVNLFVVKQNRLNPGIVLLKKAIEKQRFGKIYLANANVFWTRPQDYYDMAPWRGTWALDGGAFMNQASHYVDLIQWLVGDVESVMARTKTFARKIEAEDSGIALLNYANGAIGSIQITMCTYPKNFEGSITILGEKGTVKIGGTSVNKVEKWNFSDYDDDDALIESASTAPPSVYGYGHQGYYANVINVLDGKERPHTDGDEGLKSLKLLSAIYESSKSGTEVFLENV